MAAPLHTVDSGTANDPTNGLLAQGAGKANAGDTAGALESFLAVLQIDPENFDVCLVTVPSQRLVPSPFCDDPCTQHCGKPGRSCRI